LISSQFRLTSSAPETVTVAEHVRMPPHQLGHDPVGDVIDGVPGAVAALGGDPRVEHRLHQDVAQFLADRLFVAGFERLQRLVGLLEQVRRQRGVGLPGIPWESVRSLSLVATKSIRCAPQVVRPVQQPGTGRDRRVEPGSGSHTTTATPGSTTGITGRSRTAITLF